MKRLVVDTANLLFRVAAANNKHNGTAEDLAGLSVHSALMTLRSHYNKVKPDEVALTFEGAQNWRKTYTKSEECVSRRVYKSNRVKDDSMLPFFELIKSFENLAREHTSLVCLSNPFCEGDDLFQAYVQKHTAAGDQVVGLSGDKDFVQLLKYPNFTLLNPDKLGAARDTDKNGNKIDPEFFMFEKAFRGEAGDFVMPAYPRVRSTRLLKAFTDEYERTNIMNETWTFNEPATGEERVFRVGDLFEENQVLMNLERQPDWVRAELTKTLEEAEASRGTFSFFEFSKFCGKYKLKKIGDEAANFVDMLSGAAHSERQEETKAFNAGKRKSPLVF